MNKRHRKSGGKQPGKPKKMPGKSMAQNPSPEPMKPSMYLYDQQIPAGLKAAKPGDKVQIKATAVVDSKRESRRGGGSMDIEIQTMAVQAGGGRKKGSA